MDALLCLALTVYFEAGNQSLLGQVAVAQVVMQRVEDEEFPNTVCGVVFEGGEFRRYQCQFSWWCDGKSDTPIDEEAADKAVIVADAVMNGGVRHVDLLGVTHYHADYVNPRWTNVVRVLTIGNHIFYARI